jgi:ligand-binding sensor domain-containing protein
MKLIITLALLAVSQAQFNEPGCNNVISIRNISYEQELLKDNMNSPYQMVIDYDTNTLFFSYTANSEDNMFKSVCLNLNSNEYRPIPGIKGGFAAAVDRNSHKVYLGGRDGIYEYDYATHKATNVNPDGHNIWQMFAKDTLYYTAYPEERVYSFEGGNSAIVPELKRTMVLQIAIDNNNNMYFSNSSGLFFSRKFDKEIIKLGEYNVKSFTSDFNGNLYFSTTSSFYEIDIKQNVNKLVEVDNDGMVVEKDNNFIYASRNSIIRLKATKKQCF